jgi:hypothetical protein
MLLKITLSLLSSSTAEFSKSTQTLLGDTTLKTTKAVCREKAGDGKREGKP